MWGRNHKEDCGAVEARVVHALDEHEQFLESLTPEELIAVEIVYGTRRPEGQYSRNWAYKVVTQITRNKLLAMLMLWCMRNSDIEKIEAYLDYFLPKAPRQDKILLGGDEDAPPMRMAHEINAEEIFRELILNVTNTTRGLPGPHERLQEPGVASEQPVFDPRQAGDEDPLCDELGPEDPLSGAVVLQPDPQGPAARDDDLDLPLFPRHVPIQRKRPRGHHRPQQGRR
jgi:hypothetical protein